MKKSLKTSLLILTLCLAIFTTIQIAQVQAIKSGMIIEIEDPVLVIEAGDKAKTTVTVTAPENYNSEAAAAMHHDDNDDDEKGRRFINGYYQIYLTIRGLPEGAVGVFMPSMGFATFESDLIIVTASSTDPGVYILRVSANAHKHGIKETTTMALVIEAAASKTDDEEKSDTDIPETEDLIVKLSTTDPDGNTKLSFNAGETVNIFGTVQDSSLNEIQGASVSIQVTDGNGNNIHIETMTTSEGGIFEDSFTLAADAPEETYTVFATVTFESYSASALTTFTVGESTTASVSILDLKVQLPGANGESTDADQTIFTPGSQVEISFTVSNQGADLDQGCVWIEIQDPNDAPIDVILIQMPINNGESAISRTFTIDEDAIEGAYLVGAFVSTGIISEGGVFLDKEETIFIVGSTPPPEPTDNPPVVLFEDPQPDETISGLYRVNVTVVDEDPTTLTVGFSPDGVTWADITGNYDDAYGYYYVELDTTALPEGELTIYANATDSAQQTGDAQVTATVDNEPELPLPTVEIVHPLDGETIAGLYRINVTITNSSTASVELLFNETGSWEDITANYDDANGYYYYTLETTSLTEDAPFKIDARVTDTAGTAQDQHTVTVDNVT